MRNGQIVRVKNPIKIIVGLYVYTLDRNTMGRIERVLGSNLFEVKITSPDFLNHSFNLWLADIEPVFINPFEINSKQIAFA